MQGQHYRRNLRIVQRQQRQGLSPAEPLPRHLPVRGVVLHAQHQHGLAEVVQVGGDAHGATRFGEAAVRRHQQLRAQRIPVAELHRHAAAIGLPATFIAGKHNRKAPRP